MVRELLPNASIGTDLIAGFPGEDDAAFARTLAFVEASPVTYGHVFPYAVRQGTTAAKFDGRNPRATIAGRARQLRDVCDRKRVAFAQRFDGTVAQVLVETTRDPRSGELRGYTRNYLRVRLDGPDAWMGSMVPTRLRVSEGRVGAEALA